MDPEILKYVIEEAGRYSEEAEDSLEITKKMQESSISDSPRRKMI